MLPVVPNPCAQKKRRRRWLYAASVGDPVHGMPGHEQGSMGTQGNVCEPRDGRR